MKIHSLKKRIFLSKHGKILRNFLVPFLSIPNCLTYVFIVGCYNSGTTLLNYILGQHEEISNLPTEGVFLTDRLSKPEDFGWPRMWWKCRDKIFLTEKENSKEVIRIKKEWGFWFDKKKAIFLEKSVANSARIRWLNKSFDHPYFITKRLNNFQGFVG